MLVKAGWLVVLLILTPRPVAAATHHVGPGRTFSTIQACLNAMAPGDVCNVHAGVYAETLSLPNVNGTAFDTFVVRNEPGDEVTVRSATSPVLAWNGRDGWTFDGIDLEYTGSQASPYVVRNSNCLPANYSTLRNLSLTVKGGTGSDGAALQFICSDQTIVNNVTMVIAPIDATAGINGCTMLLSSNLTFTNNVISGEASETTGRLNDGCSFSGRNLVIADNTFSNGWAFDYHPDGIVLQGDGDRDGNTTANVTIARNTVVDFSQGIFVVAIHKALEGSNCVCNNLVYETSAYRYGGLANKMNGIVVSGFRIGGGNWPVAVNVYNNTVAVKQQVVGVGLQAAGSDIQLKNNLFMNPGFGTIQINPVTGVAMDYNYYSGGSSTPVRWVTSVYPVSQLGSAGVAESHGRAGVSDVNSDYSLRASSDARSRGVNLSGVFSTDRNGNLRPTSGAWDIGAFQYVLGPPSNVRVVGEP